MIIINRVFPFLSISCTTGFFPAMTSSIHQQVTTLYGDHRAWLQSWLRKKVGDPVDAADLTQDTFVRLLSRAVLPDIRDARAMLSTVAKGLAIDLFRRRDLENAYREALSELPESLAPSPETQMQVFEALLEIDRLLAQVKPRARQAFLLARIDGLTCPEIADQLGVSLATIERDLATALRACWCARRTA